VEKHKKELKHIQEGAGDFNPEGFQHSIHRQEESAAEAWNTFCPQWHSSHDPGSVLGFSTQE
jgi:hypothetical protein